jgi:hypothetical protein
MTPEVIASLPIWALLVLAIVWVVVKQVVPYINKSPAPPAPPKSNHSSPMMPAALPAQRSEADLYKRVQELADQAHDNANSSARFEAALERHFELDRQQFDLLRAIAGQLQADSRAITKISETMQDMSAAMKVLAQTQETILRRVLEDTGRFNLPPHTRG